MSLNKPQQQQIIKEAENRGYSWSSDGSKMITKQGDSLKFSETGGSVQTKAGQYNTSSDAKKSNRW